MKSSIITTLAFLYTALVTQAASVSGVVKKENGYPLAYANVEIVELKRGVITNNKGQFKIENVEIGTFRIRFSNLGFQPITQEIIIQSEDEEITLDITLRETIIDLQEVSVTSSITGGKSGVTNIAGSSYYISPKELEAFKHIDIQQILYTIPGVNIQQEEGYGLRPNIGMRGVSPDRSSKITIMEDGILVAPAPYSASAAYYFPSLDHIEAVEVLKGSSQIKYGPFTNGGAINLISTPIPDKISSKIYMGAGSFFNRRVRAQVGGSFDNIGFVVSGGYQGSNGFKDLPGGENTGFHKEDIMAKFRVKSKDDANVFQSLTFKGGFTNEVSNETYVGLTLNDFKNTPYRRYFGSKEDVMTNKQKHLSVTHLIQPNKVMNISTSVYLNRFDRNWYKLNDVRIDGGSKRSINAILSDPATYVEEYNVLIGNEDNVGNSLFVRANNREHIAAGAQTNMNFNFETKSVKHNIDFGLRYHYDKQDRFQWDDEFSVLNDSMKLITAGTPGTQANRFDDAKAFSSYLIYELSVKGFTITPGVRYENIELSSNNYGNADVNRTGINLTKQLNKKTIFIPGVSLMYQINKTATVFSSVHKGFAPPSSNPETRPEESVNFEIGSRIHRRGVEFEAVYFLNKYKNLLGSDLGAAGGTGSNDLFNGGRVMAMGVESMFSYDLLSETSSKLYMPIRIAYTYTQVKFLNDFIGEPWGEVAKGDYMPYISPHQFSARLSLVHKKFDVNIQTIWQRALRTIAGQDALTQINSTDNIFMLDISANYKINKYLGAFVTGRNLTNGVYMIADRPAGYRPNMPVNFEVGVNLNF
jgi:Fe(3+) dicitrate transport protein